MTARGTHAAATFPSPSLTEVELAIDTWAPFVREANDWGAITSMPRIDFRQVIVRQLWPRGSP